MGRSITSNSTIGPMVKTREKKDNPNSHKTDEEPDHGELL